MNNDAFDSFELIILALVAVAVEGNKGGPCQPRRGIQLMVLEVDERVWLGGNVTVLRRVVTSMSICAWA